MDENTKHFAFLLTNREKVKEFLNLEKKETKSPVKKSFNLDLKVIKEKF